MRGREAAPTQVLLVFENEVFGIVPSGDCLDGLLYGWPRNPLHVVMPKGSIDLNCLSRVKTVVQISIPHGLLKLRTPWYDKVGWDGFGPKWPMWGEPFPV